MSLETQPFGRTRDGTPVSRHRLRNARGTEAVFIDHGATLSELHLADARGGRVDVVPGFDALADFEAPGSWFGCVVGRVANRIGGASFELGGVRYALEPNDGRHQLHGGRDGLSERVWSATEAAAATGPGLRFACISEDGDGGYPGRVEIEVEVRLFDDDRLRIEFAARVDRPTPLNLTHHPYWNLAGGGDVLRHELEIAADRIVEVDAELIPTGRLCDVASTPYDFRRAKPVGRDIEATAGGGYDVGYVLASFDPGASRAARRPLPVARLRDPASGRWLELATTAPCLQLYTGQDLDGRPGKGGRALERYAGLCLEAQQPTDAVHHPHFPSIVVGPDAPLHQVIEYAFGCD